MAVFPKIEANINDTSFEARIKLGFEKCNGMKLVFHLTYKDSEKILGCHD